MEDNLAGLSRKKSNNYLIVAFIGLIVLLSGIIAWLYTVKERKVPVENKIVTPAPVVETEQQKEEMSGSRLLFQPESITVKTGSTENTYDIFINTNGLSLTAGVIEISFNSAHLEITDITPGDILPVKLSSDIQTDSARIDLGIQPTASFNGSGHIATITFKAKKEAVTTEVAFTANSQLAASGQTDNVLVTTDKGTIVITD